MSKLPARGTVACAILLLWAPAKAAPDILIADFEGKDYGAWRVTGEAFGPGPARGTLAGQMPVSGYEGKGLVNTFFKGDDTVGTLTSPPFKIERKRINFLIGGGAHPGQACIDLLIDGKVVRTATGPNDKPGGTERLDWHSWDVAEFAGKMAVIRIVDNRRGGWGHINIDHIVQSDRRKGVIQTVKDIRIERDYIVFRIGARQGARSQVSLIVGGKTVRRTAGANSPKAYWVSWDVAKLKGKTGKLCAAEMPSDGEGCPLSDSCAQSDKPKGILMVTDKLYRETYRPQFHFTARKNWLNDPNGLMYYKGEYHLFFQHNPKGINWGHMTWGHAVSPDMIQWRQLDHAIYPDKLGTIFSGSGVVDQNNTAGFQTGDEKVLVCIYTSAGGCVVPKVPFTQSIAYSNDRGRTWTKYGKNPVLGHIVGSNRDPKVLWHEPTKKWVMALFLDKNDYALFTSSDLKKWTRTCDLKVPGAGECPDFFELPVDPASPKGSAVAGGDAAKSKWLFWGGNGSYLLGTFDGKKFTQESGPHQSKWGRNCYAAQTWSDVPASDGRRLQIAWMAGGKYPDMPFNQQMAFPCELTLRTTPEGIRLYRTPVKEIENIHKKEHKWADLAIAPDAEKNPLADISGELFDIRAEIELGAAAEVGFEVRGEKVAYDVKAKKLSCLGCTAPLAAEKGRITLQILVDRTSIEVFGNGGRVAMCSCFLPSPVARELGIYAVGPAAKVVSLRVYELRSIWPDEEK